ncbi:MAG: trans-aconitate 2-methyltransferase [Dehalococcoidia bacterium]
MASPGNRWLETRRIAGADYDATYARRAAAGENVHGEADLVESFSPRSVLDAGCGTGRVARELARRGREVAGVDIDPGMLATARAEAPTLEWRLGDVADVEFARLFDVVVMAGNVMIFVTPGSEPVVLANMARHLNPGGFIVAGFQVQQGRLAIDEYDRMAENAGLALAERWSTWDRRPTWQAARTQYQSTRSRPSKTEYSGTRTGPCQRSRAASTSTSSASSSAEASSSWACWKRTSSSQRM